MRMRTRVLLVSLVMTALCVGLAWADDEQEIRALLGPNMATLHVAGSWAMADVGSIASGDIELVLLRRHKGHWRRLTSPATMSRGELMAMGVPDPVALEFGLGEVPMPVIETLNKTLEKAKIPHKTYNIVTWRGGFLAYTTNDPRADGFIVWAGGDKRWSTLFQVAPNATEADIDATFDKYRISRFIEYRLRVGRGSL